MSNRQTLQLTDENFDQEVLASRTPVLVDFWAPWRGPCRVVGPILEQIAAEHAGVVKVGKVNVDENERIPARYRIQSIPTLLVFKDGKIVDRLVGAAPKARIESLLPLAA